MGEQVKVSAQVLAKADAGIDPHLGRAHPGRLGGRAGQRLGHFSNHILVAAVLGHHRRGCGAVHGDPAHTQVGGDMAQAGTDIVDDAGADGDGSPGHRLAARIDRHHCRLAERFNHVDHAGEFLGGGYGLGTGPCRLPTDVDDGGALGDHHPAVGDRIVGGQEGAAVGERVGRGVQDAHHQHAVGRLGRRVTAPGGVR